MEHQGDDHQGAEQIADRGRDPEQDLQGHGHDGRLQGEEDEGEGGIDQ